MDVEQILKQSLEAAADKKARTALSKAIISGGNVGPITVAKLDELRGRMTVEQINTERAALEMQSADLKASRPTQRKPDRLELVDAASLLGGTWDTLKSLIVAEGESVADWHKALPLGVQTTLKQLEKAAKEDASVRLPSSAVEEFITHMEAIADKFKDAAKRRAEELKKAKYAFSPVPGEHGSIYLPNTTIKLLLASIQRGVHVLLVGEPGAAKTDTGRALPALVGYKLFHMEVSGFSDVSQMEATQTLEEKNGASVTTYKPTPLIEALEAEAAGEKVVLFIDELARTADPGILNPLLLLLAQGEYHAVIGKKVYRPQRERFCVVASANVAPGYNFSGNNRRGLDDALVDRFRIIRLERPKAEQIGQIVEERVNMNHIKSVTARENILKALTLLYSMATKPEQKHIITVRSLLDIADAWVSLDPSIYTLPEVMEMCLRDRTRDEATLTGLRGALEAKGI